MSATVVAAQSGTLLELKQAKRKLKGRLQQSAPADREQLRQQLHVLEQQLGLYYREATARILGSSLSS